MLSREISAPADSSVESSSFTSLANRFILAAFSDSRVKVFCRFLLSTRPSLKLAKFATDPQGDLNYETEKDKLISFGSIACCAGSNIGPEPGNL
jgi:hypothetical protein